MYVYMCAYMCVCVCVWVYMCVFMCVCVFVSVCKIHYLYILSTKSTDFMSGVDKELSSHLAQEIGDQDDNVARALADLRDQLAKEEWGQIYRLVKLESMRREVIRMVCEHAVRLLKKYIHEYPFVERMGERVFCPTPRVPPNNATANETVSKKSSESYRKTYAMQSQINY